jgi:hypothetical protein
MARERGGYQGLREGLEARGWGTVEERISRPTVIDVTRELRFRVCGIGAPATKSRLAIRIVYRQRSSESLFAIDIVIRRMCVIRRWYVNLELRGE